MAKSSMAQLLGCCCASSSVLPHPKSLIDFLIKWAFWEIDIVFLFFHPTPIVPSTEANVSYDMPCYLLQKHYTINVE